MIRPDTIAPFMRSHRKKIRAMESQIRQAEWSAMDRIRRDLETPIEAEMISIFDEQSQEAVRVLRGLRGYERASILTIDLIFDFARWIADTAARLSGYFRDTIFSGYATGDAQIDIELPDLTSNDPVVAETLADMIARSRSISETTRDDLAELIERALREGWSFDKTADEVQNMFTDMAPHRARTIAVTNVTAGFGRGQLEAMRRAGVDKIWLSQRDGRVRPTHYSADGQRRHVDEFFEVGTALLLYPGDPEGGTGHLNEIMGCRCAMLPATRA